MTTVQRSVAGRPPLAVTRERPGAGGVAASETLAAADPSGMRTAERTALIACFGAAAIAILFPHPATKVILGTGLALLFVALSVQHFHIAVALFVFFLPLHVLLPRNSFLIRGLNLETLFVLGFWALSAMASSRRASAPRAPKNVATRPLLCFMAMVALSAVHSAVFKSVPPGDLFAEVKTFLIYWVFVFFTFKHIRTDHQRLYVLSFVLVVITLVACQSLQSVLGDGSFNPLRHRATSMMLAQPNLWGGFLAMYSFFFLSVLLNCPMPGRLRLLAFVAAGIVLMNLAYTQSRGAWLALAGTAIVVGGMKSRRMLLPLAIMGTVVYLLTPTAAIDRFRGGFEGEYDPSLLLKQNEEDEAATRVIQWRTFLPLLGHYGITGAGYGQYSKAFEEAGFGEMKQSPHSTPIQIGIEQGVVGLLVYLWLFGTIYRRAAALLKETENPVSRVMALGLLGCTLCLLLLDLSGTRSRTGTLMLYYWMIAGMTLNIPLKSELSGATDGKTAPSSGPTRLPVRVAVARRAGFLTRNAPGARSGTAMRPST